MAFNKDKFVVLAGQGKRGEAFQTCGYLTKDDKADVLTDGYFNELKGKVSTNDVISVYDNTEGAKNSYTVVVSSVDIYGNVEVEDSSSVVTSVNGRSGDVVLDSSDVGLENVDNTSDIDKPISNATQTALDNLEANLQADIDTNTSNIATNTSDISTNTANIANNTADITTNTLNIATNITAIADQKSVDNIKLPINDTIYYGGEFDASTQYTAVNNPTYNYADYSYTLNGTNQYSLFPLGSTSLSSDDFAYYTEFENNTLNKDSGISSVNSASEECILYRFGINNKLQVFLSSNGTSWDIANNAEGSKIDWSNTAKYQLRLWKDTLNSLWKVDWSDDGLDVLLADNVTPNPSKVWTNDISISSTAQLHNPVERNMRIGARIVSQLSYLNGKIYLNNTALVSNGVAILKPQDTAYILNTTIWKGTARSDDNTSNITADDYIFSPELNKNEVPIMTSNSQDGYIASASSNVVNYDPYKAFDGSFGGTSRWASNNTTTGYLQIEMPTAKRIRSYIIKGSEVATDSPKSWVLKGSNTGLFSGEEVVLDTVNDQINWGVSEDRVYTVDTVGEYSYIRLDISDNNGSALISISEFILSESILILDNAFLFVGFDNDVDKNVILEWDTDIDGANLSTITGAKRRIGDDKDVSFPTDGNGDLAYFERNFDTWEFELWSGEITAGTVTLNNSIENYLAIDATARQTSTNIDLPIYGLVSEIKNYNTSQSILGCGIGGAFISLNIVSSTSVAIDSNSQCTLYKLKGVK